jgi:hypothetical protein
MTLASIQLLPEVIAFFIPLPSGKGIGDHTGIIAAEILDKGIRTATEKVIGCVQQGIPFTVTVDPNTITATSNAVNVAATAVNNVATAAGQMSDQVGKVAALGGRLVEIGDKIAGWVPWYIGGTVFGKAIEAGGMFLGGREVKKGLSTIGEGIAQVGQHGEAGLTKLGQGIAEGGQHLENAAQRLGDKPINIVHSIDPTTLKTAAGIAGGVVVTATGGYLINSYWQRRQERQKQEHQEEQLRKQQEQQTKDAHALGQLRQGECGNLENWKTFRTAVDEALLRNPQLFDGHKDYYKQCFTNRTRV